MSDESSPEMRSAARRCWVSGPTAVTSATAVPATTVVPANSMQRRSASGVPGVASTCFSTDSDSPVSADSSTSTSTSSRMRASAGTTSWVRTSMTSPGRSCSAMTSVYVRSPSGPVTTFLAGGAC